MPKTIVLPGLVVLAIVAVLLGVAIPRWTGDGEIAPLTATPPPPPLKALLRLGSTPWARVESIRRLSDQLEIPGIECTTPCWITLPPGEYEVQLANPKFPEMGIVSRTLLLGPGERQMLHLLLPGFQTLEEVDLEISRLQVGRE